VILKSWRLIISLSVLLGGASALAASGNDGGRPMPSASEHDAPRPDASSRDLLVRLTRPATNWLQAFPLGNGRLGAMVFGGVAEECLVLNEDTLYSEEPADGNVPLDITQGFDQVVAMLRRGEYVEADDYVTKHWLGRSVPCYQPLGDLRMRFEGGGQASGYVRTLDLSDATCRVRFQLNGVGIERETFVSHPDDAIILRLKADRPGALTLQVTLESQHPTARTARSGSHEVTVTGQLPGIALRRTLEYVEERGDQGMYPELWSKDGSRRMSGSKTIPARPIRRSPPCIFNSAVICSSPVRVRARSRPTCRASGTWTGSPHGAAPTRSTSTSR
jgi:Glycosyl hydrolase family 65, N-terminal domain